MAKKGQALVHRRNLAIRRCEVYMELHSNELMLLAAVKIRLSKMERGKINPDELKKLEYLVLITDWRQR